MIWIRELYEALLNRLKPLFEDLTDYYGNKIEVDVFVKFPDTQIKEENYPCLTIMSQGFNENLASTDLNSFTVDKKIEEGIAEVLQKPTMFTFDFQLDIFTLNPLERDAITEKLITKLPSRTVLEVTDKNGNIHMCSMKQVHPIKTLDFISIKEERVFRNVIDIKVDALVQQHSPEIYPLVESINTKIN